MFGNVYSGALPVEASRIYSWEYLSLVSKGISSSEQQTD